MYYFKDENNKVFVYAEEQIRYVPVRLTRITKEEADIILSSK